MNDNTTNSINNSGREEIAAVRTYKLSPEEKPKEVKQEEVIVEEKKPEVQIKYIYRKSLFGRIFLFLLIALGIYTFYSNYKYNQVINSMNKNYSPVSTIGDYKNLDINSTFVKDLYNKVKTSVREDIAEYELNDSMKLYLAYRAIPNTSFFKTDCTGFDDALMVPYTCPYGFEPNAFKEETLKIEYEKLFGEGSYKSGNIQIGKNCVGGYEYIASKGEYVQGSCNSNQAVIIKANKELKEAISYESTIYLKEDVKYISEGTLPGKLENGTYVYVFKLDNNYNYNYITKYKVEE